ncbi:MAG: hypothetical protein WDN25_21860 [Acetobacteraceae bacterium]
MARFVPRGRWVRPQWMGRWIAAFRLLLPCLFAAAPSLAHADPVLTWNSVMLDTIRQTSALLVDGPPEVAREMAMLDTAMFDAVNAATGLTYRPFAYTGGAVAGVSADAAALAAGYRVMTSIFSSPLWQMAPPAGNPAIAATVLANIDAAYASALSGLNTVNPQVAQGLALGQAAADAVIAKRAGDGANAAIVNGLTPQAPPGSGTVPGVYVPPSASGGRPEMMPTWGTVTPFGTPVGTIQQYQAELPTAQQIAQDGLASFIKSPGYAQAVLQAQCGGSATALSVPTAAACAAAGFAPETPEQRKAALFWNDPGGTMQPPGHWLQIANTVMTLPGMELSLLQEARLSALLSMAEADAGIAAWGVKYQENLWRPITAIRDCSGWNSAFTTCDATWTSLIATPPHPDYLAGHPAFSAAAAEILQRFFGTDAIAFCSTSDPYVNGAQGPVGPLTECFDSFSEASTGPNGAEFSRVSGGIHTPFAVEEAADLGQRIGVFVFDNNLQAVPEPATGALLAPALIGLALYRRRRDPAGTRAGARADAEAQD